MAILPLEKLLHLVGCFLAGRIRAATHVLLASLCVLSSFSVSAGDESADDIRLIIDISGSMKQNDPANLRIPATNLLLKLLPKDAKAGIWIFGESVNMIVPYGKVDAKWKRQALAQTNRINASGLYTNIGAALEEVLLNNASGGTAILLTDGMVDISKNPAENRAEQQRIINQLLPSLVAGGAKVHTVALSNKADAELMQELARSTGGINDTASSATDLTRIFLRMFDDAVSQDRLPIDQGRFVVDSSVEEFTLLVFRSDASLASQLKDPAGDFFLADSREKNLKWYADIGYELITVTSPLEGEWQLFADDDPQNRVTVMSNLKLKVTNLPNTIYSGDVPTLTVSFADDMQPITDPEFLKLVDVQLIIETPMGKRVGQKLLKTTRGTFTSNLDILNDNGRYQITVSVDGKTFQREKVQEIEYQKPVTVDYDAETKLLKVVPASLAMISDDIEVLASIKSKDGKKRLLPLNLEDACWQASLGFYEAGTYMVSLHVKGTSKTQQVVDFKLTGMQIQIGDKAEVMAVVDLEVEESKMVEVEEADFLTILLDFLATYWMFIAGGITGLIALAGGVIFFLKRRAGKSESKAAEAPPAVVETEGEAAVDSKPKVEEAEPEVPIDEPKKEPEAGDFGSGMSDIVDAWGDDPLAESEDDAAEEEAPQDQQDVEESSFLDEMAEEAGATTSAVTEEEADIEPTNSSEDQLANLIDPEVEPSEPVSEDLDTDWNEAFNEEEAASEPEKTVSLDDVMNEIDEPPSSDLEKTADDNLMDDADISRLIAEEGEAEQAGNETAEEWNENKEMADTIVIEPESKGGKSV